MTSKNEFLSKIKLYLCPPGDGVYTVHTGKHKREKLQKMLYGDKTENITQAWEESLSKALPIHQCVILGIPSDCGGGIQRGANWGPLFLRETLLQSAKISRDELKAFDIGDIRVIPHLLDDKYLNQETIDHCRKALYGEKTIKLPVSPLSIAYDFATNFHEHYPSKSLFMIGGDHSVSYPIVKAYLEAKKKQGKRVALIHFDAHTDLSIERLGIDLCFGTWAAHVQSALTSSKHFIQIGIRSSGKDKKHWEEKFNHKQYWAKEIMQEGAPQIAEKIVTHLKSESIDELYISFDIDCLDEEYAGATGTPEPEGLSPYEPMHILQTLFEAFPITGADLVEIAPMVKASHTKQIEPETTLMVSASIATFLIQAMGVSRK